MISSVVIVLGERTSPCKLRFCHSISRVFGSMVVVAFQIAFCAEIHANDVFSFFKNYF